jgi:tryptophan synthase alpha chain
MNRIDATFARLKQENRRALMPFLTAGDPDLDTTRELIEEMVAKGASLVEVGLPYSDPIADGPVIAASYTRALRKGVRQSEILAMAKSLRDRGQIGETPLVAMGSYAIFHRQGVEHFLKRLAASGFDGLIVPDLPVEESDGLANLASALGLKLIQLVTPTTPRERALQIARSTTGFIYYVSVAGITGERKALPPGLAENVAWLRTQTHLPVCIGFGIGSAEQVKALAPSADGLIVGSALVRRLADAEGKPRGEVVADVGRFIAELAGALG